MFDTKGFDRFFVGFDPILKKLTAEAERVRGFQQNYPPDNIKKIDENNYLIEMAVAGFDKQDLEIELANDKLIIRGNNVQGELTERDSTGEWTWPAMLYQGLAMRPFTSTFNLANNVEICNASLLNGILKIALESIIPEHKKPKKIKINETEDEVSTPSTAEFLAERKDK